MSAASVGRLRLEHRHGGAHRIGRAHQGRVARGERRADRGRAAIRRARRREPYEAAAPIEEMAQHRARARRDAAIAGPSVGGTETRQTARSASAANGLTSRTARHAACDASSSRSSIVPKAASSCRSAAPRAATDGPGPSSRSRVRAPSGAIAGGQMRGAAHLVRACKRGAHRAARRLIVEADDGRASASPRGTAAPSPSPR